MRCAKLLLATALALVAGCGLFGGGPVSSVNVAADSKASFGPVPSARLVDSTGAEVSPERLRGSTWALASLSRPLRMDTAGQLERLRDLHSIVASSDIHLVWLSTNPLVDTPEALAAFATDLELPGESWFLWTGAEAEVARLIQGAWSSSLVGVDQDELERLMATSFESRVVVVDSAGEVRGTYDLFSEDGPELLVSRLRAVSRE
ncbi:MAG: hypothetical protein P1V81_15920 [Planctomycetota bacterium]|nr:hypothetical protein [Planctomycetota bacterium]